jgi:ferredoxin
MKIVIDNARCQGTARCYKIYTTLFAEGPEGKGVVKVTGELETDDEIFDAQSAVNACPQGAVQIED